MTKKRIISFSLYGEDSAYFEGALANSRLTPAIYPGWICRIYVSDRIDPSIAEHLSSEGADVIIKHQRALHDGMLWRFFAASDPDADVVIIRDIDSRLGPREKVAVDEWLASDSPLHIIRDHPSQKRLMPGGLWGVRGGVLPDIERQFEEFLTTHDIDAVAADTIFLAQYVYAKLRGRIFVHSEFAHFPGENPRPIPVRRNGNEYLGFPPDRGEMTERRLRAFDEKKDDGLTEYPIPEWLAKG